MTGITCNIIIIYIYITHSSFFPDIPRILVKRFADQTNCIKVGSYGNSYHFAVVAGIARAEFGVQSMPMVLWFTIYFKNLLLMLLSDSHILEVLELN